MPPALVLGTFGVNAERQVAHRRDLPYRLHAHAEYRESMPPAALVEVVGTFGVTAERQIAHRRDLPYRLHAHAEYRESMPPALVVGTFGVTAASATGRDSIRRDHRVLVSVVARRASAGWRESVGPDWY